MQLGYPNQKAGQKVQWRWRGSSFGGGNLQLILHPNLRQVQGPEIMGQPQRQMFRLSSPATRNSETPNHQEQRWRDDLRHWKRKRLYYATTRKSAVCTSLPLICDQGHGLFEGRLPHSGEFSTTLVHLAAE